MGRSLSLYCEDEKLILVYTPRYDTSFIKDRIDKNEDEFFILNNQLLLCNRMIYSMDDDSVELIIAQLEGEYYRVDKNAFSLKYDCYFSCNVDFAVEQFLIFDGSKRMCILRELSQLIENDLYVEIDINRCDEINHIPFESYKKLLKLFPKQWEIGKYLRYRVNYILEEYIFGAEERVKEFENLIQKKNNKLEEIKKHSGLSVKSELDAIKSLKLDILRSVRLWLKEAIDNSEELTETDFQQQILNVLLVLFPQYLYAIREVEIKGMDSFDKIPDFLLIDSNGSVDVLEIKKPEKRLLRDTKYRNNYAPSRELTGTALQVEKYILCLQRFANDFEQTPPPKVARSISDIVKLHVINPRGMIIIGSDKELIEEQQRMDFEIIRKQYKHVVDIITYDDLLRRLDAIIKHCEGNQ